MTGRARAGKKDRGETEAVVQASAVGATVLVDDPWGRELAERYSLECHGTIWVLERLHALGLLTPSRVRQHLRQLEEHGIRFPREAANQLLQRLGEQEF